MVPQILLLMAVLVLLVLVVGYLFAKQLRRQDNLPAPDPGISTLIQSSPVKPSHSQDVRSLPIAPPPRSKPPVQEINPRVDPRRQGSAPHDDQAIPPPK